MIDHELSRIEEYMYKHFKLLLMGLLNTKGAAKSTRVLIVLPISTMWFHHNCRGRFESAFLKLPLQDAMLKDSLERAADLTLNLKAYMKDGYVHPVFKCANLDKPLAVND